MKISQMSECPYFQNNYKMYNKEENVKRTEEENRFKKIDTGEGRKRNWFQTLVSIFSLDFLQPHSDFPQCDIVWCPQFVLQAI